MNELDSLMGSGEQPELSDLMPPADYSLAPPKASIRNRAATLSLFSNTSEETVNKYKTMLAEGEQGSFAYTSFEQSKLADKMEAEDKIAVISILSDPLIKPEQKDFLVKQMQTRKKDSDPHIALLSEFSKQASQDETPEAEESRVGMAAKAIREMREANEQIQGIVNAHAASLDDASAGTVLEIAEYLVAPFGTNIATSTLAGGVYDERTAWEKLKSFVLPGSEIKDLRTKLESLPAQERIAMAEKIAKALARTPKTVFGHNQFAAYDKALQVFGQGGYSTSDEWLDNIGGLLDAVGIGFLVKPKKAFKAPQATPVPPTATKAPTGHSKPSKTVVDVDEKDLSKVDGTGGWYKELPSNTKRIEMEDQVRRIETNVAKQESPLTPHATAKQTNPQKAREFHETIVKTQSDEVSEALAGEDVIQSVANDVFPQATTETGRVTAQAPDIQRNLRRAEFVPERVKEYIFSAGRMDITPEEAATARANVVRRFNDAEGLRMEDSMSSFTRDGGNIKISAMYGTSEGAFLSPTEAIAQAKAALKHMGLKDDEIVLMERQGRDYVPVDPKTAAPEGSYYVRIDTKHEIDPTDIVDKDGNVSFENFAVWGNLLDRLGVDFPETFGSMQRHVLDAQSMLDKRLTGAASGASDRAAALQKILFKEAAKFTDQYVKLKKKEKLMVSNYLREANFKEIPFDEVDLMAREFTPKMVSTVKSWREYWDGMYYLENLDVVRTFRAQGFKRFTNSNADLYAKPVAKDKRNSYVYDPDTDAVVPITPDEMDNLYDMGGTIAKLRRPADFGGETVEHILVRNQGQSFLKDIRDTDSILNYKEGYYNIQYNSPRFVREVTIDPKTGNEIIKAVAVAGDTVEAQRFADRMTRNATKGEKYIVTSDARGLRTGTDDWFDIASSGGRIAQRHRGKLLEDAAGLNQLGDGSHIVDPVTSAIRAARSISGRTVTRPILEYAKARFMKQYGKYVSNTDNMGGKKFPTSRSEIGAKGMLHSGDVAAARTTYEYIRYLENGYINGVDNLFKSFLRSLVSEPLGKLAAKVDKKLPKLAEAMGKVERGVEAVSQVGPTHAAKRTVFETLIAWHPFRQLVVQPHQIIRLAAYEANPVTTYKTYRAASDHLVYKMGRKPATPFDKFLDDSGALGAVDMQNLVRGSLMDAAEQSNKLVRGAVKVSNVPRVVGFDTGERINVAMHYASVYNKFIDEGRDLTDKVVIEEAYAKARALSGSMTFANDMPYNQNSLGAIMQFMQFTHKTLTMPFNKHLTLGEKSRLLVFDTVFWGGLAQGIYLMMEDAIPDDPKWREILTTNYESYLLNKLFRRFYENEDIKIDFTSLSQYSLSGFKELYVHATEDGVFGLLANSPAGQVFGPEGKIATALMSSFRFFGMAEPLTEKPEDLMAVTQNWLEIASGVSAGMRAWVALKTGERYDKQGVAYDRTTQPIEAFWEGLGFSSTDRAALYAVDKERREMVKSHRDDVIQDVKALMNYLGKELTREGVVGDERQLRIIQQTMAMGLSRYAGDPIAQEIVHQQIAMRLRDPNEALAVNILKAAGIPDEDVRDLTRRAPISEEKKQMLLDSLDRLDEIRGEE